MKQFRRIAALLVALLIALSILTCAAFADGYKVKALKLGAWNKLTSDAKTDTLFKLTLKKDSYLILEFNGVKLDSILEFEIYTDSVVNWDTYCGGCGLGGNGKKELVIAKGTYYIKAYNNKCTPKLKMTVKALPKAKNTSKAKAAALRQGQGVKVAMLGKPAKPLWYKIKTTQKQKINVCVYNSWKMEDGKSIEIYNAKGKKLPVKYSVESQTVTTKAKQKAGTYYICVPDPGFNRAQQGGYLEMVWQ